LLVRACPVKIVSCEPQRRKSRTRQRKLSRHQLKSQWRITTKIAIKNNSSCKIDTYMQSELHLKLPSLERKHLPREVAKSHRRHRRRSIPVTSAWTSKKLFLLLYKFTDLRLLGLSQCGGVLLTNITVHPPCIHSSI